MTRHTRYAEQLGITVARDTIATPGTGDVITISNFWPELPTTRLGVVIITSSHLEANVSPGTLTVGDGTDASSRDLVITLGAVGTAGSGVIITAFGIYHLHTKEWIFLK